MSRNRYSEYSRKKTPEENEAHAQQKHLQHYLEHLLVQKHGFKLSQAQIFIQDNKADFELLVDHFIQSLNGGY